MAASTEYDSEKVQECLSKAGFDARSARMEKGLDTWLYKDCDADGVSISGGEEQKIALARALYQNAAFEASADARVLKTVLAQDGYMKSDFEKQEE